MIVAYIEENKICYDVLGKRRGVKNIYKLERTSEEEVEGSRFILDGPTFQASGDPVSTILSSPPSC